MFRAFGHEKSSVLDGGLPRWEAEGFPIEAKPPVRARKSVYPTPVFDKGMIRCELTSCSLSSNVIQACGLQQPTIKWCQTHLRIFTRTQPSSLLLTLVPVVGEQTNSELHGRSLRLLTLVGS